MTDNKAPSYPWYPRDFAADEPVQLMSLEEEGAYRRLLDHQWLHGSIPGDVESLARICKNTPIKEMRRIWAKIEVCFVRMEGQPPRYVNRKLERVRQERAAYVEHQKESGSRGGKARWERERQRRAQEAEASNPTSKPTGKPIESLVAKPYPASAIASASAKKTWLTPFADAWSGRCGNPPHGRLAKALAPLVKALGEPETLVRWSRYLAGNEPRYCSPERFAATHAAYAEAEIRQMTDDFGRMVPHRQNDKGDWVPVASIA